MTPAEADKAQQWAGMPGDEAYLLIERHARDWTEVRELMEAWKRAGTKRKDKKK